MTYREIAKQIANMTAGQRDCDAAVLLMTTDEVMPVMNLVDNWDVSSSTKKAMGIDQVDGVLDDDSPFFTISY